MLEKEWTITSANGPKIKWISFVQYLGSQLLLLLPQDRLEASLRMVQQVLCNKSTQSNFTKIPSATLHYHWAFMKNILTKQDLIIMPCQGSKL